MGLSVEPPDVQLSDYCWRGRENRIRVGLQSVYGLRADTAARITRCRRESPFSSSTDFLQRVKPADDEVRSLIDAGGLDSLNPGSNRSTLFWEIGTRKQRKRTRAGAPLLGDVPVALPSLPPPDRLDLWRSEYRALGFLCRAHPITLVRKSGVPTVTADKLTTCIGRSVFFVGWLLTGKLVSTRTGDVMEFLTFEDETGIVETTFFPGTYRRYAHILASKKPYLLGGLVESDYGAVTLTVDQVQQLGPDHAGDRGKRTSPVRVG
jgi:DNA polymerase-3 subunit alpha/error-prone DNA polymerase